MAEKTRRFRNSTSRSIAAVSAIALALGGVSVVGPGPLAPQATAAQFTGGIRDKSGAVEKDAQKASDLPAGSCVVNGTTSRGRKAGFTWNTLEPGPTSPDKTLWGLSLSFDNSKDRTFADWYFSNSGNLGDYLNMGTVPAMEAGQTFLGEDVTQKADESIAITAARAQRNLNLYADLTDAEVKQFASATVDNPVRYAWQGHYTKDNVSDLYAVWGPNASFGAVVNPWPSENIECNPITVSWEDWKKHVIVPGEETKVGKINIPAVYNGGTDDSMSRMVVEVYDGNGEFIGTTDPAASGGAQNLRIDETTGDIYFTWPEYRGTDLADDKNVNFSVLAKPRSVDQLQAAAENNNFGEGKAFDSSNSLTRYNKANVIDSKAFSLDDTEYHSPQYDKTDTSIISGVDSTTGPIATEPQKVTFTQTPDLIADLVKKKGDGGFEAKATLDDKYVYEGWTVEMDEDYNVTVTAPENPRPGTFARPVVTVEYSNGSTDVLDLLVVVDPNNTQVTDLVRPGLTTGTIGHELTALVGTKSIMKGHKAVHPAKFEIEPESVPDGWTVTVDETGKVTAKADDTVAPGTIITPKVKATYPDGTTDEIETQFQAIVDIKVPEYDTVTNKPTAKVTLKPTLPEVGLSGNTSDKAPKRYTFPEDKTEYTVEDGSGKWTVRIDETTGEITTTIPKTAPEGYKLDIPVLAYYDNADKPQEVKGTVVVLKSDVAPVYDVQTTGPNQAVEHHVQDAPKGSKYSFGTNNDGSPITEQEVDGWKYKVDPNTGVVSSTPPADAKPGDKKTINVTVTTPDGPTALVPVTTVVKLTNNWEAEPTYPVETVYPGDTATLPVALDKPENVNVAKDSPYKLGAIPAGWTVTVDDNGQITATAPADAKPGTQVEIPVTVTYEDGSTDTAKAVVNVVDVPKREVPFKVEYKYDDSIPAGEYKVETKGVAGEEKQNKDGTWKQTKAPVNEVVLVGTKPAESAKDVTWTVPIPYPTEVRENPDLKPGETRVVQEGENGEKTYTAKFTAKGSEAQVAEEETTKEPVTRIIEVGPGLPDQELTSKKTQEVPFEIEYVYDDTLESGKQVVDQEGVPGEQTITSTQKIKDGKPDGEPSINIEETKAPQKAKIRVGTKTTGETTKTVESEVPFGVKVEFDPNLPAGTSEVVTEGKPGKKTTTVTQKVTNSQPDGEATVEEKVTEQPVDQVIKVGTKPSEASEKVTWTAQVPFEVETRPNPDLKPGEIKVVQKGVPGEKTYTADFAAKGDQASVKPEEKQTKDPVNEIIEYGPAAEDTTVVTKVEKPVPFETEIVFDDTLAEGEQKVDQQGETGTEVVTSTQKIVDGKPSGDPEVNTERTKEPKKQIIRVGTKTTGQTVNSVETEIPFEVEVVYDPTLKPGEQKVTQEGEPGTKKVTVTQPVENSKPKGDAKVSEETVKEPKKKIIAVGTKPAEASNQVSWTVDTPYDTIVRPNPDLKPGEVKTVQEGEYGQKKFTADFESTGEDSTVTPKEEELKKPTDKIIEFGPTIGDQTLKATKTREIPFETEFVYDETLPAGEQVVDQQGENGEEVTTSTQEIKDGKPVGEPQISTEETKAPKKAIIRIGTKMTTSTVTTTVTPTEIPDEPSEPSEPSKPSEPSEPTPAPSLPPKEVELPFTTKIIYDETLEPGQEVVEQEGENGTVEVTVENGEPSVKTVKEPVEKIIRVGTKPAGDVEWTQQIPFDVKVELDPEIPAGEYKVAQQGMPGEVHHKSDGTEETVKEKVDHIIKVGTKTPTTEPSEPSKPTEPTDPTDEPEQPEEPTPTPEGLEIEVRYTTKIVYDPTLKPGEEIEDVKGENGKYVVKIVDGKPVAELVEKPVERVVRVGTKPADGVEWTEELAYDVEVQEDPNLEAGKHEIVQQGKPGERVHKEDGTIDETAPQNFIIKVGTKKDANEPTPPADPQDPNEQGSSGSETVKRCFGNAVRSPLLWLLPIGLLAQVGGKLAQPYIGQVQGQLNAVNAQIQEEIRRNTPDFGFGHGGHDNEQFNEIVSRVNAVNAQLQGYANDPAIQKIGQGAGVILALVAAGAVLYDWCSSPVGDAKTSIGGAGSSKQDGGEPSKNGSSAQQDRGSSRREGSSGNSENSSSNEGSGSKN